jgi:hypothetical protein
LRSSHAVMCLLANRLSISSTSSIVIVFIVFSSCCLTIHFYCTKSNVFFSFFGFFFFCVLLTIIYSKNHANLYKDMCKSLMYKSIRIKARASDLIYANNVGTSASDAAARSTSIQPFDSNQQITTPSRFLRRFPAM